MTSLSLTRLHQLSWFSKDRIGNIVEIPGTNPFYESLKIAQPALSFAFNE